VGEQIGEEIEGDRKNGRHKDRARGIDIKREKRERQRRGSCLMPRIGGRGGLVTPRSKCTTPMKRRWEM
jgi:hypothetical protein